MAKRLILAILLLCLSSPAVTQSFPKPPDVADYVDNPPTFAAGTTANVVGDGTVGGGTPPATELTEVNPVDTTSWLSSSGAQPLTNWEGGSASEAKSRFLIGGFSHCLADDPIRNYGRPGTSHFHCFFGNTSTNAYSTYATLRQKGATSRANGGPLNATGYWVPAMLKKVSGQWNYALRNQGAIILYYAFGNADEADNSTYMLLGLRYVTGYNMDDNDAWLQARIDAANAQPGTAGRYQLCQSAGNCDTKRRWTCSNATYGETASDRIANSDGSDAFSGRCNSGDDFWMQFEGASCWDGRNLWSPGGYKHVYPAVWDNVYGKFVCGNGHYRIPKLTLQVHYPQAGITDRANMKLSCDDVAGTAPGMCFHTDWFNGWQRSVLRSWLEYCIGVKNILPSRECNDSAISGTQRVVGTPSNTQPPASATDTTKMFRVPSSSNGPKTIHIHGG